MLKGKPNKLEPKSEVCLLVGYPKETRGYLFYRCNDNKVFVSTNAKFLENDYMNDYTPKSRVVLVEMNEPIIEQSMDETRNDVVVSNTPQGITQEMTSTQEPYCSVRIIRPPVRFIGLGETYEAISEEAESNPCIYEEGMKDIDAHHWVKAMKSEFDSMYSNQVWDLVKAPNGIKPIGCTWVYKRKRGIDEKFETFKERLVVKWYTQKEGIDYKETFSPVVMLKSIKILLSIAAHYGYEIWQMDVKIAFLNDNLDEEIYMMQPEDFIAKNQEHMVCKLKRSIYGLKQASRSWNIRFDQAIKSFGFKQNLDEPCVYERHQDNVVMFLVLYVDDILLIGNDVGVMLSVKIWLSSQFDVKDLGKANHILGIKLGRNRKNRMLGLSQAGYIDKILARFSMQNSKKGLLPFRHGVPLFDDQRLKTLEDERTMRQVSYASQVPFRQVSHVCHAMY